MSVTEPFSEIVYNGEKIKVATGIRISEIGKTELPCSGHGKCGKCKVKASGCLSEIDEIERKHLSDSEIESGIRLACRAVIKGYCEISSLSDEHSDSVLLSGEKIFEAKDPLFSKNGIAIDVGTTTLASRLFDEKGNILSEYGEVNPQEVFGADVISRIESALSGNSDKISDILLEKLDRIIEKLIYNAKQDSIEVGAITITGNTAMLYLLSKTSTEELSHSPFNMSRGFGEFISAGDLGLSSVDKNTKIYFPPCISAFVGADTVCALISSDLVSESKDGSMLADIGTNGEMAIYYKGKLSVCSTAAGPAFEGVGISMGMRGKNGAIDKVTLSGDELCAHVIGECEPVGICGSGLVDSVACLLENEILDETGFVEDDPIIIKDPVVLTAKDIRMVQLAKSAISSGLKTLVKRSEIIEKDIISLEIAGGFGTYLDLSNAVRIGLIPDYLLNKSKAIGNAALDGASMILLDKNLIKKAEKIARSAETVDLSTDKYFSDSFIEGMLF